MREFIKNRPVFAWALYDWANSAFATTVMAGFFPVFFQKFWSTGVASTVTTSRLGYANAAAGLVIALLAPILGAIGDRGGRRKQFLFAWTLLGVGATVALYFVAQGQWFAAAVLFVLGTMGFNGGVVFNDSLLLDVAKPADLDRVSAFGYSLGYLGGGLLFLVNVLMVSKPAWFGLADAARGGARVLRHRRGLVAGVHDPADARRAGAAARSAPGIRGGDARRVPRTRRHHRARAPVPHHRACSCSRTGSTSTA